MIAVKRVGWTDNQTSDMATDKQRVQLATSLSLERLHWLHMTLSISAKSIMFLSDVDSLLQK